ncbi:MAG: hypothetical protein J6Y58_05825 [Clostridiales bacterium]|nr:hypothetical protein [Clostridiales bacterium]
MKKTISVILSAIMILSMCGCTKKDKETKVSSDNGVAVKTPDDEGVKTPGDDGVLTPGNEGVKTPDNSAAQSPDTTTSPIASMDIERVNAPVKIVDKDGKEIKTLQNFGPVRLMESGIFYTAVAPDDETVTQYRIFDPKTGKDKLMGEIKDQGYIASYAILEVSGKIYTLTTVGNLLDQEPDQLLLLELDPETETMEKYVLSEDGFPYCGMTEKDGEIVLFHHDQQETLYDRVMKFDPKTKEMKEIMCYELPKDMKGETVRGISFYGDKMYVLTVRFENANEPHLMITTYDGNYKKLESYEISNAISEVPGNEAPDMANNEMKQMVSAFQMLSETEYYYESFSDSAHFGDMKTGKLLLTSPAMECSKGSGKTLYRILPTADSDDYKLASEENGVFKTVDFAAKGEGYWIFTASSCKDGHFLIGTCVRAAEKMEHPEKVDIYYYLDGLGE